MTESHTSTTTTDTATRADPPPPSTTPKHQSSIDQARNTVKKAVDTILGRKR